MKPQVELIYDSDCPNVGQARLHLREALARVGLEASWVEWDRANAASPRYARDYGSPTILIRGADVGGGSGGLSGDSCRIYRGPGDAHAGAPSVEAIVDALKQLT